MASKVRFGLKNVHYAILMDDGASGSAPSWSAPVAVPGAVTLDLAASGDISNFYADNIVYFTSKGASGFSGDLEVALVPDQMLIDLFGYSQDMTSKVLVKRNQQTAARFALLYQIDGDEENNLFVLYNCTATDPNVGLALSADHATQKCYMADTGLLVTHTFMDRAFTDNELYKAILFDKLDVNEGMIMENIVAQMLRRNGHKLYFYSRSDSENRENHMEIDFLITENRKISPIEVKSANYRSHSSLDKFRKKFSNKIGAAYILYPKDVMQKDGVWHLPLYMAMFL